MPTARLYQQSRPDLRNGTGPSRRRVYSTVNGSRNRGCRESSRWQAFVLPPVVDENYRDKDGNPDRRTLVAARFPEWLQCPQCDRLAPSARWSHDPGRAYRYCAPCTRKAPGQRKVFAVPIRFVMACVKGHLDDFPWHIWVEHKKDCKKKEGANLYLRSQRPGLAGLILSCCECKARRSMDGIFSAQTWRGFGCRGLRPWLAAANETCDREPRALQRGASNLYFPVLESALSIPPWSDALQEALGVYWNSIVSTEPEDRATFIQNPHPRPRRTGAGSQGTRPWPGGVGPAN